jgi:hypothetical protein
MRKFIVKVFEKEEHADNFINMGEMKFTSNLIWHRFPDEFKRRDENEGLIRTSFSVPEEHFDKDITISDISEKTFTVNLKKALEEEMSLKAGEQITVSRTGDAKVYLSYFTKIYIYSAFLIDNDFIKNKAYDDLKKFGNYCVFVDLEFLIRSMELYLSDKVKFFEHKKVIYITTEQFNDNDFPLDVFHKDIKYLKQNELRMVFIPNENHQYIDYIFPRIGNISKISQKSTVDNVINEISTAMKMTTTELRDFLNKK